MNEGNDAFVVAFTVADALESAGLPYAIGGAHAYNLYSVPRATKDVDLNVFVDGTRLDQLLTTLHRAGVMFDDDEARRGHADGGYFVGHLGAVRVDVFTPSIPYSWEAGLTRRRAQLDGREHWYLSAEATALFKLLFFRGKDVVDLERLVATQQEKLDHVYVRRWIVEMMGEDDPRTKTWDDLVARFGHS
ncbi:MAG: hypothetical protein ABMA64_22300 [Myxococcota bacterium]